MKKNSGVALITVLWVMVLLMVIVTEFGYSMKSEVNTTRNLKEEMEAYYLAKAGINLAIAEIVQDADYHYLGSDGELMFGERVAPKRKDVPLGSGTFSYMIQDEGSKLNINSASGELLAKFFEAMGGEAESAKDIIADSILDWIDQDDDLVHDNGAENDYYMGLPTPYECKDSAFDTIDELLLVRGVPTSMFYGKKDITDYLTVRNSGINMNTASLIVLTALYNEEKANEIIQEREKNGGIYSKSARSSNFTVISTGKTLNSPIKAQIKVRLRKISYAKRQGIKIEYWDDNFLPRK